MTEKKRKGTHTLLTGEKISAYCENRSLYIIQRKRKNPREP